MYVEPISIMAHNRPSVHSACLLAFPGVSDHMVPVFTSVGLRAGELVDLTQRSGTALDLTGSAAATKCATGQASFQSQDISLPHTISIEDITCRRRWPWLILFRFCPLSRFFGSKVK